MLFRSTLAAAAVVLLSLPAVAADLPTSKPAVGAVAAPAAAPVVPTIKPISSWSGFYVGANAGAAFGENALKPTSANPNFFGALDIAGFGRQSDTQSFTGGVNGGYNYQFGPMVVGLETDFNYANLDQHRRGFASETFGPFTAYENLDARQRIGWFGTVRPRVGYSPIDSLLIYGTGGLAYGQVKGSTSLVAGIDGVPGTEFGVNGSKNDWRVGWTLGGGAEYQLTENVTVKGEYLYVNLGKERYFATSSQAPLSYLLKDEASFHTVRTGLNYKF